MSRASWDDYFANITRVVSSRATCHRAHHGAIAVRGNRIIATGYNGQAPGARHCTEMKCMRETLNVPSGERYELCRSVHAEQNVICQAAKNALSLDGATIYVTDFPCMICAKLIVLAGFIRVVALGTTYANEVSYEVFSSADIEVTFIGEDDGE